MKPAQFSSSRSSDLSFSHPPCNSSSAASRSSDSDSLAQRCATETPECPDSAAPDHSVADVLLRQEPDEEEDEEEDDPKKDDDDDDDTTDDGYSELNACIYFSG
jgi:hypothetical protein